MKKLTIYGLALFALLISIVVYHLNWRAGYLYVKKAKYDYEIVSLDAGALDSLFGENYYNENNPTDPFIAVNSGDQFKVTFTEADSILYYSIKEDSPSNTASIICQIYTFDSSFRGVIELQPVKAPKPSVVISKKEFTEVIRKSDVKHAFMQKKIGKTKSTFLDYAFTLPYIVPLNLFLCFIAIWMLKRFSEFFGQFIGVSSLWVLGGLLVIALIYICLPSIIYFYERGEKHLFWDLILSAYTMFCFSAILIFIGYWFLVRKHSITYDFIDREAFKFFYILLFIIVYLVGLGIMRQFSFNDRHVTVGHYLTYNRISFAIIFATANFLNNFRSHYLELRRKGKSLIKANSETLESISELAALQSRVNPHFLYNSLNSIASLADTDSEKTKEMALALSEFYKYSTNREDEIWTTIPEEIEMIKKYLEVEKIRFGDKLDFKIFCSDNVSNCKIPKFLIQPLVENAIKFGYNSKDDQIDIIISAIADKKDKQVTIAVQDSGPDFPDDMDMGLGIRSVQKKLNLTYPDNHHLSFSNKRRTLTQSRERALYKKQTGKKLIEPEMKIASIILYKPKRND